MCRTNVQVARCNIGQENAQITEQMSPIFRSNRCWHREMCLMLISLIIVFHKSVLCCVCKHFRFQWGITKFSIFTFAPSVTLFCYTPKNQTT